jgi:hypothetical protein
VSRGQGTRGAILVEFWFAFVPLFTIFLCLCELTRYFTTREVAVHAASIAVRSCAVIDRVNPGPDLGLNGKSEEVRAAVLEALGPWHENGSGNLSLEDVQCKGTGDPADPHHPDEVTVQLWYRCSIPIARELVCERHGAVHLKRVTVRDRFPHQGARYVADEKGEDF